MTSEFPNFATRLRERALDVELPGSQTQAPRFSDADFDQLALELFALQFAHNPVYRRVCKARRLSPEAVKQWRDIPAVPTTAFKECDVTCLPPAERTHVFHSSGTTEQRPSRHFHCTESLAVYEASLWPWFARHVLPDLKSQISNLRLAVLTPPSIQASHSSLVYMLEIVRRKLKANAAAFCGMLARDGAWELNLPQTLARLREAAERGVPLILLGTAFSFVQLLDFFTEQDLRFKLPPGSRVMETGGYKGRSRNLPKAELHALITDLLAILPSHIVCEYGMSELSSQAYDTVLDATRNPQRTTRAFRFPPWARAQVVSPESGREVANGETGLLRVFDLANVFSVLAIQTEDLCVRRDDGFELLGRAPRAEPRGCSLMAV